MADTSALVEQLSGLTVLEVADLVKALEEKWGVSAAAPVAMMAGPAAGGGAAEAVEEPVEEEPVPLQQDEAVLVVLAVEPDICAPGGDYLQRHPYVDGAFHSRAHSVKATRAAAVDPHPRTVI